MSTDPDKLWFRGADIPRSRALAEAFGALVTTHYEQSSFTSAAVNESLNALALATAAVVAGCVGAEDRAEKLFLAVYSKNKESMIALRKKTSPYEN